MRATRPAGEPVRGNWEAAGLVACAGAACDCAVVEDEGELDAGAVTAFAGLGFFLCVLGRFSGS